MDDSVGVRWEGEIGWHVGERIEEGGGRVGSLLMTLWILRYRLSGTGTRVGRSHQNVGLGPGTWYVSVTQS